MLHEFGHALWLEHAPHVPENREERDALVELGCDLLQGCFFAKPGKPFPIPDFASSVT